MQYTHILGIDISKDFIDLALSENKSNASMVNTKLANNLEGYQALLSWLDIQGVKKEQLLICLENTGIYHRALVVFLQHHQIFTWVENPIEIKWSIGLQRGKNDQVDAQRICMYAFRNQDKAQPYMAKDEALQKLTNLLTSRERLMGVKKMLSIPIKELHQVGLEKESQDMAGSCNQTLDGIQKDLVDIEKEINTIIAQDKQIKDSYELISSVPNVGRVTALYFIVTTNNSKRFDNAKQLASYSGIAPFEHRSGTSVRAKSRVNHMANKTLKRALLLCAVNSLRHKGEMRLYYERKVGEGKNKMSVINAIRNKILKRIFACLRDKQMYINKQAA